MIYTYFHIKNFVSPIAKKRPGFLLKKPKKSSLINLK